MLSSGFKFVGDMLYRFMTFLAKPLSYLYYFFDGVFYFFLQLFNIVVKIVMIFVALIQLFAALVVGFLRTVFSMLTIDFSAAPHFPSKSGQGIAAVMDVIGGAGMLTVAPGIVLAVVWFIFIKQIIGLLGGARDA